MERICRKIVIHTERTIRLQLIAWLASYLIVPRHLLRLVSNQTGRGRRKEQGKHSGPMYYSGIRSEGLAEAMNKHKVYLYSKTGRSVINVRYVKFGCVPSCRKVLRNSSAHHAYREGAFARYFTAL
jgi:hypothetical protein